MCHLSVALDVDGRVNVNDELLTLLAGETRSRADAAVMIGMYSSASPLVPALVALQHDDQPTVTSAATVGLAQHLIHTPDSPHPVAIPTLTRAIVSGGGRPALDVAQTLAATVNVPAGCRELLRSLGDHPSARVRNTVADLVSRGDEAGNT